MMPPRFAALLGAATSGVGVGLICGHYLENGISAPAKLGIVLVSMLVGAALGRIAFR